MKLIIRDYHVKDEEQFNRLISLNHSEDYILRIVNSENLKWAFSVVYEDELLGVVVAWKNNFHPFCTYFQMLIHPFYRNEQIEKLLLSKLESNMSKSDFPLQTSIWETSVHLKEFLEENGCYQIRKTYMPKLELTEMEEVSGYVQTEYTTPLATIVKDYERMSELVELVKATYVKTHLDNPVRELSKVEWEKLILEDVIKDGSFIQFDQSMEHIIAYSFVYESDEEETLELGWCGRKADTDRTILPGLVCQQICYGLRNGYSYLTGEFDTTDRYALEVLRIIPFSPSAALITYQKQNGNGEEVL